MNQLLELALQQLSKALPQYAEELATVRPLAGSRGNRSWLIEAPGAPRCVLKLPDSNADRLGLNFVTATSCASLAAESGLAPSLLWYNEEIETTLSAYLESQTDRYADPSELGALLAQVHALPVVNLEVVSYGKAVARYAGLVDRAGRSRWDSLASLGRELDSDRSALTINHHDPTQGNMLFCDRRWLLVDWEYAAAGDPHFDLAAVMTEFDMDDPDVEVLLDAYGLRVDAVRLARYANLYRGVRSLWGAVQTQF